MATETQVLNTSKKLKDLGLKIYIDLVQKYNDDAELKNKIKNYLIKNENLGFKTENKAHALKAGDFVFIRSGYNSDILYKVKIVAFLGEDEMLLLWDCYWFTIKLSERLINLEQIDKKFFDGINNN